MGGDHGDGLPGEERNPAGTPAQYSSAEDGSTQGRNSLGEVAAYHPDPGEDQDDQTDHRTGVLGEGFDRGNQGGCARHINRAMRVSGRGEGKHKERRDNGAARGRDAAAGN